MLTGETLQTEQNNRLAGDPAIHLVHRYLSLD